MKQHLTRLRERLTRIKDKVWIDDPMFPGFRRMFCYNFAYKNMLIWLNWRPSVVLLGASASVGTTFVEFDLNLYFSFSIVIKYPIKKRK